MEGPEVRQTVIGDHNIFTATGDIRINYHLPPAEAEERRILRHLADSVKRFWIEGVLERSLHEVAMLELRKEPLPAVVQHPWERILELPGQSSQSLAGEKKIGEIFFETGRSLLILGEPGAGKTVTLLELARELIGRFETDPTQGAPVVLNLSTWQDKRRSLAAWIEAELKNKYFVPFRRGRAWLESSRLFLLLDGLDEVSAGSRASCVHAINEFLQNTGAPGIAVCSRRTEYTALPARLNFTGAVCLQPLTVEQIDSYLEGGGNRLAALRQVIRKDPPLQELARSPLMLNVISLAYQDLPAETIADQNSNTAESHLFERYVERMFERVGKAPDTYPRERTKWWLSWLGREMRQHSLTVFLLENLQPSWLPSVGQRWVYAFSSRVSIALSWMILWWILTLALQPVFRQALLPGMVVTVLTGAIAGIVASVTAGRRQTSMPRRRGNKGRLSVVGEIVIHALVMGSVFAFLTGPFFEAVEQFILGVTPGPDALHGWHLGLVTGVRNGLICGLLFGLKTAWRTAENDIRLSGTLRFSFAAARKGAKGGGIAGAIVGVILVVIIVIQQPQLITKNSITLGLILLPVVFVLGAIIVGLLFAFVAAMFSLFSPSDLPGRARPGQGLALSAQNALLAGIAVAASWGIPIAVINALEGDANYLRDAAMAASALGLAAAVWYGGLDVIQHITLRFLLRRHGYVPKNYVGFLDYATRLVFLQKVGSGYIFVHRQLLDYFFELSRPETKPGREFLEASISERHREEEKTGVEKQPELEMECAPSPVEAEPAAEAEQRAKEQREGASKVRRRVVLALGAVVATWMVGALIFLALWLFWEYQANRYFNAHDYAKALPLLQKAANAGSAPTMTKLGWLYENGRGVGQDYGKARQWYEKAADAGNALAMNNLGVLYENGRGVAQDYGKARQWYQKAADAGNALAMNNFGLLYENGRGVAQDYGKAREWYQKAADAGNTFAMNKLGWLYQNGWGVAQDYGKARQWYQKAANAGNALAMNSLGLVLIEQAKQTEGAGATELLDEAVAAYRSALEVYTRDNLPQDWAQTQNNLGTALWTLGNQLEGEEGLKRQRESMGLLRDVVSYQPDDLSRCRLASVLGSLAFNLVLNSQFAEAQTRCEEAQRLANEIGDDVKKADRDDLIFIQQNLAHALFYQGHYDEALVIYRQCWDKPLHGKTFGEVTLEDFAAFDKAGLTHPDLSRMKRALGDLRSRAPGR
jgi:eukaryotic-like serine/threonine-protein kinase